MAPGVQHQGISSWRGVHAGTCYAWPLPADATCATVARQAFRDAVSEVGLEPDLLEDCILMASELAANTLHAQAVAEAGGGGMGSCPWSRTWRASRSRPPARSPPSPQGPSLPRHAGPRAAIALPGSPGILRPPRRSCVHRPSSGCICAAWAPGANWSARSSTATAAGGMAPRRRCPGCRCPPGHQRARAADRARAVRRPVGTPSHPGQAGRLGSARQGGLVRGARSAGPCPAGGRDRPVLVHGSRPMSRRPGPATGSARARRPGNSRPCWTSGGSGAGWYATTSRPVTCRSCPSAAV